MNAPAPNSTAPKVVGAEKIKVVVSAIVPLNNLVGFSLPKGSISFLYLEPNLMIW